MKPGAGKDEEAHCPMCGSKLAGSPAGKVMLRMLAEHGKAKGMPPQGGQGMGMRRMGR